MSRLETAAAVARPEETTEMENESGELTELDKEALQLDSEEIADVQLDGMALMKIVKHCKDSHASNGGNAWGALLGVDVGGTLDVSNAFALPGARSDRGEEEDRSTKGALQYMGEMLRLLRQVSADVNAVGMYQGCFLGPFLNTAIVDGLNMLSVLMEREGNRGRGKAVLIVHDFAQLAQGNLVVKAFRLSPAFINAYRSGKMTTNALIENRITFSTVLLEIPVQLHNTALLNAFVATLTTEQAPAQRIVLPTSAERLAAPPAIAFPPRYMDLNLGLEPVLVSSAETTLETLEAYSAEAGNVNYQARQIAREKARAESYVARRRAENASRAAAGLAPLPIDDVSRMFKIPQEPNRLETLLLLNQLDSAAHRLSQTAAVGSVQLDAARTGAA
ncbi:hypothetical protein MSPP1_000207 [Malassezia sp. CBS 17886]|nr:hypothetical protein MSPP1_000207 [Malassezia sp. CBS 17886]